MNEKILTQGYNCCFFLIYNSDSPHRTLQIGDDSYDVNVEEYTATKKAAIEVSDDKFEYKHKDTASFSYNR